MKLNKEKLNNLLKMYRLTTIAKNANISYSTLVRLSSKSKKVNEIETKTLYKLAKGLQMSTDELINKIYDFDKD